MDPGEKLLRLVLYDEEFIENVLGVAMGNVEVSGLDARTHAIIRLGALLALDAPAVSYQWNVDEAFRPRAATEKAKSHGEDGIFR